MTQCKTFLLNGMVNIWKLMWLFIGRVGMVTMLRFCGNSVLVDDQVTNLRFHSANS